MTDPENGHKFISSKPQGSKSERWKQKTGRSKVALCSAGERDGPWLILKTLYYLFKKPGSKSCTHSRSPVTGFCIDLQATTEKSSDFLRSFSCSTFFSGPDWSLRAGCLHKIYQWWLILWAAAMSSVESFWVHRQILQMLSATLKSFIQLLLILLLSF